MFTNGLERMKQRVGYKGYDRADNRNVTGKYKSFLAALKNSYQAEWITLDKGLETERRWRCLINPSRLTEQFDKKVISIEFESGMAEGTVFWWDRTNRYWIVDLQQHTEEAYFRGTITRADSTMDIDGHEYWVTVRGPIETTTQWNQKHGWNWNNLNYSMVIQITKDSRTIKYFSRHNKVKMKLSYPDAENGKELEEWHNWKVVATDKYSSDRVMDVYLDEWYDNEAEDAMIPIEIPEEDLMHPHIEGPAICYVFDTNLSFSIVGMDNGKFVVNSDKVKIKQMDSKSCLIDIIASKSTSFILSYEKGDGTKIDKKIDIKSF